MSETAVLETVEGLNEAPMHIVCGRDEVLQWKEKLTALCRRYGQDGAVGQLEYYLARPAFARKKPTLLLTFRDGRGQATGELASAVLVYEHQLMKFGSRIFSADFHWSARTVIAPDDQRARVALAAADALFRRGAILIQMSYAGSEPPTDAEGLRPAQGMFRARWASKVRQMIGYLPIEPTVDATLANLGKMTRRNLRRYRKRAEAELGHVMIDRPQLTPEEFFAFNAISSYPAPAQQVEWRYHGIKRMPSGSLFLGLRAANGEWLSFIGGRSYDGITHIEWQMNRADMPSYSLSTLMRAHLIEYEVERGTRRIYFIGGTSHSMRNAIATFPIVDITIARWAIPRWLLRRVAPAKSEPTQFVGQMLFDEQLAWYTWE